MLSASRKADRGTMAAQVASLAAEHGLAAVHKLEEPDTRRTAVDVSGPHGLRLTVRFDGGSPTPNTYVLSWHGVQEGTRLDPAAFATVNPHHGHKATDVAFGFAQLLSTLRQRFAAIADGSAFVLPESARQPDPLDAVSS